MALLETHGLLDYLWEFAVKESSGRVKMSVGFALPDAAQCSRWWAAHASQLNRFELLALGRMSSLARLSFRELWAVAECMVQRVARRHRVGGSPGQVGFAEYASQILRVAWNS